MERDAEVLRVFFIMSPSWLQLYAIASCVCCIVTLEKHSIMGGLGVCVTEEISTDYPLPIRRIGIKGWLSALYGSWDYLPREHLLDVVSMGLRVNILVNLIREQQVKN